LLFAFPTIAGACFEHSSQSIKELFSPKNHFVLIKIIIRKYREYQHIIDLLYCYEYQIKAGWNMDALNLRIQAIYR
jgi:hypothetical protein